MPGRPWTDRELEVLRQRFPTETGAAVARALGRSNASVYTKAAALRVRKIGQAKRRYWTPAEDEILRRDYATLGARGVAEQLDRTKEAVRQRAGFLRVPGRSPTELAADQRRSLSEDAIEVAELLYARGMTYRDIARELGVHARTVASHILPDVRDHYRQSLTRTARRRLARRRTDPERRQAGA